LEEVSRRGGMSRKSLAQQNLDAYFRTTKAPGPLEGAAVGDKVSYTRYFLKQLCVGATDPMWHKRGTIVALRAGTTLVNVLWDGETEPRPIQLSCLAKPGPNLRFCE
jgi:hypothetical protein